MRKRLCLMLTLTLLIPVAAILADANEPSAASDEPAAGAEVAEQPILVPSLMKELLLSAGANVQVRTLQGQLPSRTPRPYGGQPCLAGDAELCGFGERLMRERPCLVSGECPAYQTWEQVMGEAGVRPAPESAMRAVVSMVPSLDGQSPEGDERD